MTEKKTTPQDASSEKTTEPKEKKKKIVENTMKITVVNSLGVQITATGIISDRECKAVIRALDHSDGQIIKIG